MTSDEGKGTGALVWRSRSERETVEMGRRLGSALQPGDLVALIGPLGSGKTCLTKGIALGVGVASADLVTSPTFVYLRIHQGRLPLYHLDAYRLRGEEEFFRLGGWEMLGEDGVSVIEWAERLASALPADRIDVRLATVGPSAREIRLEGAGEGESRLKEVRAVRDREGFG